MYEQKTLLLFLFCGNNSFQINFILTDTAQDVLYTFKYFKILDLKTIEVVSTVNYVNMYLL